MFPPYRITATALLSRVAAGLALALACSCIPLASAQPSDEVSQVQVGTEIRSRNDEGLDRWLRQGRPGLVAQMTSPQTVRSAFDCWKYPDFCKAPFNCQEAAPFALYAKDNHSYFHPWCSAPSYYDYMTTCIQKKRLREAGRIQYEWSIQPGRRGVYDELDASYCFIEGHCTNTAVRDNTTAEEAEKMCDARYGHAGWAQWNMLPDATPVISGLIPMVMIPRTGFHDKKITRFFLKLACVMGNYHCDVMYCKETYCKKEHYIKKFKHLQPKTPGHLLRQHTALPLFEPPI